MHNFSHQPLPRCLPSRTCSSAWVLYVQLPTLHFLLRPQDYLISLPLSQTRDVAVVTDQSPITSRNRTGCQVHQHIEDAPSTLPVEDGTLLYTQLIIFQPGSSPDLSTSVEWELQEGRAHRYVSYFPHLPPELARSRSSKNILRAAWMNDYGNVRSFSVSSKYGAHHFPLPFPGL